MAYEIHCKWNGNTTGTEELTTDRKSWRTLKDVCGKENKKASEAHRRLEYYTGKWCCFTSASIRKCETLMKESTATV